MADPITWIMIAGTAVSAVGTIASGQNAADAANYQAKVLEVNAKNESASAQREAQDLLHKKDLILSKLNNNAASSGFTSTDKSTLDLTGDVAEYGTYQAQLAQYAGDNQAEGLRAEAAAARARGESEKTASYFKAGGTILSSFSSPMFQQYGFGRPDPAMGNPMGKSPYGAFGALIGGGYG